MRRPTQTCRYEITCSPDGSEWQVWKDGDLQFQGSHSIVEDWLDFHENVDSTAPKLDHSRRAAGKRALSAMTSLFVYIAERLRR